MKSAIYISFWCEWCVLCISPTNHLETRAFFHVKYVHGKEGDREIEKGQDIQTSYFKINRNKNNKEERVRMRDEKEINISQCEVVFFLKNCTKHCSMILVFGFD